MNDTAKVLKRADGTPLDLTTGQYHELQIAVIEKFGPRFAPSARVLYLSDATGKVVIYEKEQLEQLRVSIFTGDRLPDIILYNEAMNQLFLIETGLSHIPVTHTRRAELEAVFKDCSAIRIYVSAFLNRASFGRYIQEIAWDSHVWIAAFPKHTIYYE